VPHSIEQLGFTTLAIAVAMIAVVLGRRRWPEDPAVDTAVLLWRRLVELRARQIAAPGPVAKKTTAKKSPANKAPVKPKSTKPDMAPKPIEQTAPVPVEAQVPQSKPGRPKIRRWKAMKAEESDHMPLSADPEPKEHKEPKILLRQRFRRGLKRTRERLGSEMREAFTGGATPEAFDKLEEALIAADVGVATTTALVDDLRQEIGLSDTSVSKAIKEVMIKQLQESDRRLHLVRGRLSIWVVVGVNGTGKTTTIAKLANRARDLGLKVCLAAADTFRAAAVEQLAEWGRRLNVDVVKQDQGADPGAVVFDAIAHARANGHRLLIVDTAGRLHTRKPLMDELQKVFRVIEREEGAVIAETLLVIDATTGQNGIAQAKAFRDAVPVTGLAIAKLDGTAKGGIAFAVERELGVPVKAVGVGEGAKDLVPFEPAVFVDALVGDD
jgi:fused signal recognition particle receptor